MENDDVGKYRLEATVVENWNGCMYGGNDKLNLKIIK